jgi:hypothetical protein
MVRKMANILERKRQDFMSNLEEEHKMTVAELEGWYAEAKKLKLIGVKK